MGGGAFRVLGEGFGGGLSFVPSTVIHSTLNLGVHPHLSLSSSYPSLAPMSNAPGGMSGWVWVSGELGGRRSLQAG
jgi:hypothetical protein